MATSSDDFFENVLTEFPPTRAAFAYGSAVFDQRGYTDADRRAAMIDLVLVVDDDAEEWHRANLAVHSPHYSFAMRALGASAIVSAQQAGAGIYYNTGVQVAGRTVKYGVITESALADDLQHWTSLYISGRMHKPVQMLQPASPWLQRHINVNLRSALAAALLLLPEQFDENSLFETLCNLSYAGDVRMGVGESHRKPGNIAQGQRSALNALYADALAEYGLPRLHTTMETAEVTTATANATVANAPGLPSPLLSTSTDGLSQDVSLSARQQLMASLPLIAQMGLLQELSPATNARPLLPRLGGTRLPEGDTLRLLPARLDEAAERVWRSSSSPETAATELGSAVRRALTRTVHRASLAQTVKGVLTAGMSTSLSYALVKMRGAQRLRR